MTHASLFSGIGGPEVAATMLGWDNLFHCEINEFGRKILDYWYPNSKSYEDITKTDFSEWRGKVDVLTGGFPCQPFSYAGKRKGADDDRYLWPFMFKAIDQIRPTWIVAENVAGITTMVEQGEVSEMGGQASMFEEVDGLHRYRLSETFTTQRICDNLESHGYSVQPVLVPACAVGAPHRRDRVFIVARRVIADTSNDGCCGDERQVREERKNSKDEERNKESKSERIGLRCKPRFDGAAALATDIFVGRAGTPGESADFEGCRRRDDGEPEERREQTEWSYGFYELLRNTADTESEQSGRCELGQPRSCKPKQGQPGGGGGEDDAERHASDTYGQRPEKPVFAAEPSQPQRFNCEKDYKRGTAGLGRWDAFPTVSPVHRGNNGIPFDVDSLSIPFSKWRTESLKAYGNAIVPQVMYEIFMAIDIITNQ